MATLTADIITELNEIKDNFRQYFLDILNGPSSANVQAIRLLIEQGETITLVVERKSSNGVKLKPHIETCYIRDLLASAPTAPPAAGTQ